MKECVMCKLPFTEEQLDWLERCEGCFRNYMTMKDGDKPNIGIPYTPISKAEK